MRQRNEHAAAKKTAHHGGGYTRQSDVWHRWSGGCGPDWVTLNMMTPQMLHARIFYLWHR